ncbi:hypothetical protein EIN_033790 [Entamoeba invadens IP1]|uniref:Uncharacterized protein n=1 Tax=Entamoeba invadens IP1 TaxID=370355 RepID=A0A0A1U1K9_ENTIV|nr:hypothetical protein EIN_033790 [Entamoeba invadens IP1]ELP86488.1 hypothetical protein EIN_033790 [Entamoeba invadens IP1]|eukprot:XP_004185834.1 hypothetical protein EIN_033790 [Entamoeba invadens IP1]
MQSQASITQGSGVNLRKRFYDEGPAPSFEAFEPKRGFFSGLYQMIFHPIDFFTPEEKKVGTVTLEVFERKRGGIVIKAKENGKSTSETKKFMNQSSDFQKDVAIINENIKSMLQDIVKTTSVGQITMRNDVSVLKTASTLPLIKQKTGNVVVTPEELVPRNTVG